MNESIIQSLKKIKITYIILGLVAVILLYVVPRYAILVVSVDVPDTLPQVLAAEVDHSHEAILNEEDLTEYMVDPPVIVGLTYTEGEKVIGGPGLRFVKRGSSSISAQAGNTSVRAAFNIPWYGFAYKKFELQLDSNADKIAYRHPSALGCGVYSERLERMAQYECGSGPLALTAYSTDEVQWKVRPISDLYYPHNSPSPYKGGLLGITQAGSPEGVTDTSDDTLLREVTDEGKTKFYKQPDGVNCDRAVCIEGSHEKASEFRQEHAARSAIFTDSKDQSNSRFVFASSDGSIYLGDPKEDSSVSYKKIEAIEEYDANFYRTICSVNGAFVACIQGQSDTPPNTEVSTKKRPAKLITMDFDTNDVTTTFVQNNAIFINLTTTKGSNIFVQEGSTLLQLVQERGQTTVTKIAENVSDIDANDKVFYVHNRGVYQLDPGSLDTHLRFRSQNISPRRVITTSDEVFIIGSAPQSSSQPSFAWKLNNEPNLTPGARLIDRLPTPPESTSFGKNDLVGNRLNLDIQPSNQGYTQENIDREVGRILENIRQSGVSTDNLEVVAPALHR